MLPSQIVFPLHLNDRDLSILIEEYT